MPYMVAKSARVNQSDPYTTERRNLPNRTHGIRYTSTPWQDGIKTYASSNTVRPVDTAACARAHLPHETVDVQRIFTAVFVMLVVALVSALIGIGIARMIAGPLDEALLPGLHTANASSLTAAESQSDPASTWEKGSVPTLFQDDPQWANRPYGEDTMATQGAAPVCLTMVHADITGDASVGPVEVASFSQTSGYAETTDASALLTGGARELGLTARPVDPNELALRRELVGGRPVIAAVGPGLFSADETYVVLTDIDKHGMLVVHHPQSRDFTNRPWSFDEVLSHANALWSYTAAS